jgi:hypothetical protein
MHNAATVYSMPSPIFHLPPPISWVVFVAGLLICYVNQVLSDLWLPLAFALHPLAFALQP